MYLRLLRHNRDFRLLYAGTLISLGGDWFLTVALLDLVLQLTGSATLASLMLLCQSLPIFIFTPIAGHAVDRLDRLGLLRAGGAGGASEPCLRGRVGSGERSDGIDMGNDARSRRGTRRCGD